jgi:hypothetical protein
VGRVCDERMLSIKRSLQSGSSHDYESVVEGLVVHALARPNLISLLYAARQRVARRIAFDQYWTVIHRVAPEWLDVASLMLLDRATLNRSCRVYLLDFLANNLALSAAFQSPSFTVSNNELRWLLVRRCTITHLTVSSGPNSSECALSQAGSSLNSLRTLKLRELRIARSVFEFCPSILCLDLTRCVVSVDDRMLQCIGDACHSLQHLMIGSCYNCTDIGLMHIASKLTTTTSFKLVFIHQTYFSIVI